MNFAKYRNLFFGISLVFLIPSVFSLFTNGLVPSIDFVGGSVLEVEIISAEDATEQPTVEYVQEKVSQLYEVNSINQNQNRFEIQGTDISNDVKLLTLENLATDYDVTELRFESVGPTLSQELLNKTLTALVLVAGIITLYVWKQFDEIKYGVCAILAMFHDSIILLGAFSFLGKYYGVEVDVLFVTALLTTLSFSIHDTIVVYDRIRELKRKHSGESFTTIVNTAVTETLSRSINNSVTIIITLSSLALLGGATIQWFAVALLIGAVTGTYSSTFTAAPLLLLWDDFVKKNK